MPTTPASKTTPAAALHAIHALLHPELYDEGADSINWTGETIEEIDAIVCEAIEQSGTTTATRGT